MVTWTDLIVFSDVRKCSETPKAFLIDFGDGEPVWIPKTHTKRSATIDGELVEADVSKGTLIVTRWIAERKGLA